MLQFLDRVLKGGQAKDTPELLKILCSLVDCTDKERKELMNALEDFIKANAKKGGFMGMFK